MNDERTERVERKLEGDKEELLEGPSEEGRFPAGRKIRIASQFTKEAVMEHVILLERSEGDQWTTSEMRFSRPSSQQRRKAGGEKEEGAGREGKRRACGKRRRKNDAASVGRR